MVFNMILRSQKKKENNNLSSNIEDDKQKINKKRVKINVTQKKNKYKRIKREIDYEDTDKKLSEDESEYENSDNDSDDDFEEKRIKTIPSGKKKENFKNIENIKAIKKECEINIEDFSTDTPPLAIKVRQKLLQEVISKKRSLLMHYFKTGPGEYAEGDQFHGIPVPGIRSTLKEFPNIDFESLFWLITSSYHEERMFAALYMTELSKNIQKEEKKKFPKNKEPYHFILDNMNDSLKKHQCHTIPELIHHFSTKKDSIPGERKGWDIKNILSAEKRQIEKRERLGESRPIFLDQSSNDNTIRSYQFETNLGFTDILIIQKQILFEYYIECMPWIDNWDLVDLTSRDIIGNFLSELEEDQIKKILYYWLTYKINDQVAGYKNLQSKRNNLMVKKEIKVKEECDKLLYPSIEDLSLNTIWTRRVAFLCTFYFINNSDFKYTIFLLEKLLNFEDEDIHGPGCQESNSTYNKNKLHDLIEKASGWMLREIGKRDGSCSGKGCKCVIKESKTNEKVKKENEKSFDLYSNKKQTMIHFLNKYAWKMPRTMLRYSIEKLPMSSRSAYLNATEPLE